MSVGLDIDEVFLRRFPVHRACRDGDVAALVLLLKELSNRAHLTEEDSSHGWTPIHWAAHYGQLECVMRLVQMGCEVDTVTSRFRLTPTHSAAFAGHQHCVVWLTQAGADVNQQDFVGETPIHKAARSGSLECIQVLLIAGAKPHLKNATGQTAADLANANGFHDCFCFIANAHKHLRQLSNGNGAPCGQEPQSRKRQLTAVNGDLMKKARRAESEDDDDMNVDGAEFSSEEDSQAATVPPVQTDLPPPSALIQPQTAATPPRRRSAAEMCGSLHLSVSPSSCVSHRPAWWGMTGEDYGDSLHYGHYHGFGDTAEDLSDSSCYARHKQAAAGNLHLYHGS